MTLPEVFNILMVLSALGLLMAGYPVAFTLGGVALLFGLVGNFFGIFDQAFLAAIVDRLFGNMINEVLLAVPLFIFMGITLERSRVAEDLIENMGRLFGALRGGLGISVTLVGALLAASTGIVGATVIAMGLLALPTMLRRNYDPALACGTICAAGTLGTIIPPSIVLVLLGDVISAAYQSAQLAQGNFAPDAVSVSELFAGALLPGLTLVGLYILYQVLVAWLRPSASPAIPADEQGFGEDTSRLLLIVRTLLPPISLIVAVLGSILAGIATPTEAASVGAIGALLLGGHRVDPERDGAIKIAVACLVGILVLTGLFDLRVQRDVIPTVDMIALIATSVLILGLAWGLLVSVARFYRTGALHEVMRSTARITSMVFVIIIGANIFSLVFRGFGGDVMVHEVLTDMPGGPFGAMLVVMIVMFVLGFFLDIIEIIFVVVVIVAPVLLQMDINPIWLAVMMAVNLQTSFLTPPFGLALFYLRSVTPSSVTTLQMYKGIIPFVVCQLVGLTILAFFPGLATWLPKAIFGS